MVSMAEPSRLLSYFRGFRRDPWRVPAASPEKIPVESHLTMNRTLPNHVRDLLRRQRRERPLHQRHHGRSVLGIGHHTQTHRIDAEIADRRAQALFDRPVAVSW